MFSEETIDRVWMATSHLLLVALSYFVLLLWTSFDASECPRR